MNDEVEWLLESKHKFDVDTRRFEKQSAALFWTVVLLFGMLFTLMLGG